MSEPSIQARRWKSTLIERDRYREALDVARDRLWAMWRESRDGNVVPDLEDITAVASIVDSAWRFRQHSCPKCDGPCEYSFAMIMIGPHSRCWTCPDCGRIRNSREPGANWDELIVENTGEVLRTGEERDSTEDRDQPPARSAWQPMSTAPKDGTPVLFYRHGVISQARRQIDIFGKDYEWGDQGWSYPDWDLPTHWMRLPDPPGEEFKASYEQSR